MMKWIFRGVLVVILIVVGYYLFPEHRLPLGSQVSRLRVIKGKRVMEAYDKEGNLLKSYKISLGDNPIGHKESDGDERTPEGIYYINDRNANSGYHKNLGVSYPNDKDRSHAKLKGLSPGGDIKIHGLKNGRGWIGKFQRWSDWTNGCIALTDEDVDELFIAVENNAVIEIRP